MFRLDGEVFLLGTAIPAPLKSNKNCDDLRLVLAGRPRGGGRIVANRGSYSEMSRGRKAVGRRLLNLRRASLQINFATHLDVAIQGIATQDSPPCWGIGCCQRATYELGRLSG